ncbi:hypothetical protein D3C86_1620930 [compost metagenome]
MAASPGPRATTLPSVPMDTVAPGGTAIAPPSPSTGRPAEVWSWPSAEICIAPARVYASEPSGICTASQPLPCRATSRSRPVYVSGPAFMSAPGVEASVKARVCVSCPTTGTARYRLICARNAGVEALARLFDTAACWSSICLAPERAV